MDLFNSPEFGSHVEDLMRQHHIPGLAIAIVHNGKIASLGFGHASIDPPRECTPDTLFDIASSSKSFTAASVALLVEDEKYPEVQYDAIMSKLLPDDFVMPGDGYTEGVTVDDVLGHRTGMAGHDLSYMGIQAERPDDARSVTRNLRNLPVAAPLRSRYLYCNMMYTVATHLVEEKAQQSFSDFLHERFFQPLKMESSHLQPASARANGLGDRIATGYAWEKDSASYHGFQSPDCPEAQGAGSIMTSANDLIKWVKALLHHEGPINGRVYQGLTRMRSFPNPTMRRLKLHTSPVFYAAGVEVYYYRGYTVIGHDGSVPGFGSRFVFSPEMKFGVAVAGNSSGVGAVSTLLVRQLMDFVIKVPGAEKLNKAKPGQGKAKGIIPVRPKAETKDEAKKQPHEETQASHDPPRRPEPESKDDGKGKVKNKEKEKENKGKDQGKDQGKAQAVRAKVKTAPPQETPLEAYAGKYTHPGYHNMTVQIKDDKLFIDATDRSMGFTLTFEHVKDQTRYIAHLYDSLDGGDEPLDAEFVFENGVVVKMGLDLEPALRAMIWFDKAREVGG